MGAPYLGDYEEDYTDLNFEFTTHSSSGAPTTLSGSPVVSIFKSNGSTGSTGGVTLTADFGSVTGVNHVKIDLSSTAGPWEYDIAEDYMARITTGTVGGASVVGYAVAHFSIENRTEDVKQIGGSTGAATQLALSAQTIVTGTVDDTAFSPTTTEFEADDITTAAADHYNGRIVIFTSGTLQNQATDITDYVLTGGRGHFTVTALTSAPANNVTFVIV